MPDLPKEGAAGECTRAAVCPAGVADLCSREEDRLQIWADLLDLAWVLRLLLGAALPREQAAWAAAMAPGSRAGGGPSAAELPLQI